MSGTVIAPAGSDLATQLDSSPGSFQSGSYTFGGAYQANPDGSPTSTDDTGYSSAQPMLIQPRGSIAGIIADVVIRESAVDEVELTDNPVEKSADITDHAYLKQAKLDVDFGYSDSGNGYGYSIAVYGALLSFMAQRIPFIMVTGKRLYPSMMITSVRQTTTQETETSLFLSVSMRQVVLVDTEATTLAPASQQANPEQTAAPVDTGTKQLIIPDGDQETILKTIVGGPGYTRATGGIVQP